MDVSKLCRGCMKEVASWEKENFDTRAVEMFSFCTNIRITDEDNLPKQFCYDCIIKIESSYTFITEAQKVNVTLKNVISRKTSVIVEPETLHKHQNNLDIRLTLPDYKICSVIDTPTQYKDKAIPNLDDITLDKCANSIKNKGKVENPEVDTDDNVIKCAHCSKQFKSKTWYQKHLQKDHAGKKYTCAHCSKSFARPSQLSSHAHSHSEERRFSCATCGKRYKHRAHLTTHALAHRDDRPYSCNNCTASFKKKSILRSHMSVHEKDKKFLCYFCGCSFAQGGNLKVHMRLHTGEKPFSCGECGFRASVASNLRRHQRRHAPGKTHLCNHCGKGFNDASNLARHARVHSGVLPYACGSCGARFADSWKRKTHLMRVHNHPLCDLPRLRDGQSHR